MELKDLIGYKLEKINNEKMIVSKDDELYVLDFVEDNGDCCGYNELETQLLINDKDKPIITNVEYDRIDDGDRWNDCAHVKITFYGENKQIAEIDSLSSSGSGWCYGACVTVKCKELNINEELTSW